MVHYKEVSIFIESLACCKVCVRRVLDGLRAVEGVVAVRVSGAPLLDEESRSEIGFATVKYNPDFVSPLGLRAVLEEHLGFPVHAIHEESDQAHR